MEDTSYVSLSLEKYNELYNKAKKYDELKKELGDEIADKMKEALDCLIQTINSCNEAKDESVATTEEVDSEIKVGDLVEIVKDNHNHGDELRIGNRYIIRAIDLNDSEYKYEINNEYRNWVCDEEIKLVKKGEEK